MKLFVLVEAIFNCSKNTNILNSSTVIEIKVGTICLGQLCFKVNLSWFLYLLYEARCISADK